MVEKQINLVPKDATHPAWVLFVAVGVGACLWLAGAKLSRTLFTLAFVAAGCFYGRRLPGWFNWQFEPMASAVAASLICGVIGYSMHRWWAGVTLGVVLATWGLLGTWLAVGPAEGFAWPEVTPGVTLVTYARQVWSAVPLEVAHLLPLVCGTLFVGGLLMTVMWPRFGVALLYSVLGASLAVAGGLLIAQNQHPEWLALVPRKEWAQPAILGVIVMLGVAIQYRRRGHRVAGATPAAALPPADD
jgi:hypothetical protein